jgi:hypothetical protein
MKKKMDLFCKTFKGEVKALKKNAQTVGFQLPALTYEKLKKVLPKNGNVEIPRTVSRILLRTYAELLHIVEGVLEDKDRLVKYVPQESWCSNGSSDPICHYWCRKPKNWERLIELASESLAVYEGCVENNGFRQKGCKVDEFQILENKVKKLMSSDVEWLLTADFMMENAPKNGKLEMDGKDTLVGFVRNPNAMGGMNTLSMQVSAGGYHTCGLTDVGSL